MYIKIKVPGKFIFISINCKKDSFITFIYIKFPQLFYKRISTSRSLMYFSQLSKQQIDQLYGIYYFDLKLFNYDVDEYYGVIDQVY